MLIHHVPKRLRIFLKRYIRSQLPRGVDFFSDVQLNLPQQKIRTIFDVGANIGLTAGDFLLHFPDAQCHCFEPEKANYAALKHNLRMVKGAFLYELALSNRGGPGTLELCEDAAMHRLVDAQDNTQRTVTVETSTVDLFCDEHGIPSVDLLKIDTEGHDLKVLEGASALLEKQRIAIVYVEAAINPDNVRHVSFCDFLTFMRGFGYRPFGLYDQTSEWPTGAPELRRINAAFVSSDCSGANTKR